MYYLKYRPQKFAELFGLEQISQVLQKALEKNQVAHAYIFTGPKGTGKTTTARILAKALNCEKLNYEGQRPEASDQRRVREKKLATSPSSLASNFEPCNQCSACQAINEGRYLDLIEIDAASHRGIEDIRELRDKIKLAPTHGGYKVYIIDEAHMLTHEAFNALLKTLEEPPAHAVFVLATTEFHKLPETIRSRGQTLKFQRARREDIVKKLSFICEQEKVKVDHEKLLEIAEMAEGGFRNAETLLEQMVVGEVDLPSLKLTPGRLLSWLLSQETAPALEEIDQLARRGESLHEFSRRLVVFLRRILLVKGGVGAEKLDLVKEESDEILNLARQLEIGDLIYLLEKFLAVFEMDKYSPVPQLTLEMAVLDAADYFRDHPRVVGVVRPAEKEKAEKTEEKYQSEPEPKHRPEASRDKPLKISLEELKEGWPQFLRAVKPLNHSLEALLRSARPKEVAEGGLLTIEVFYKFHQEKLTEPRNRSLLEKALNEVFKGQSQVNFVLGQKSRLESRPGDEKSDKPPTPVSGESQDLVEAALEAFGS